MSTDNVDLSADGYGDYFWELELPKKKFGDEDAIRNLAKKIQEQGCESWDFIGYEKGKAWTIYSSICLVLSDRKGKKEYRSKATTCPIWSSSVNGLRSALSVAETRKR